MPENRPLVLIAGAIAPTAGRVKHGKTVRIGVLDQQFQLDDIGDEPGTRGGWAYYKYQLYDRRQGLASPNCWSVGFAREHSIVEGLGAFGGQWRRAFACSWCSSPNPTC